MKFRKDFHKNRQSNLLNLLYSIGIIAIILIFIGLGYLYLKLQGEELDEKNCPIDGDTGYIGLILDLTDPLNSQQSERLKGELSRLIEGVNEGTLISVGVVHSDKEQQGPKLAFCKPPSGENASELYQNPTILKNKYIERFEEPLNQTIHSMIDAEEQPYSPIIESITSLVASTPGIKQKDSKYPKKLIIVSDLVQNSEVFSFYQREVWDDFRRTRDFSQLTGILEGFDILIIRIPIPQTSSFDPIDVDDFWVRYLDVQKVKTIRLDKVTLGKI